MQSKTDYGKTKNTSTTDENRSKTTRTDAESNNKYREKEANYAVSIVIIAKINNT